MKTKNIQINDLFFHTEHFGDRKQTACLLIAGAMAPAHFWTDTFCEYLAEQGYFVIRYDHRDIGESSAVDWDKNPYTLYDLAKDAIGILDAYAIKQAHFVGHSMGGYICQRIALEFPTRTLSITIISAGPFNPAKDRSLTEEEQVIQEKTWEILLNRQDGPSQETKIQSFLPVWKYLNGRFPFDESMALAYTKDLILRSHHQIRQGNHHELVMRNLEKERKNEIIQQIPTLIIHGELDWLSSPKNGVATAQVIPESHLVIIPEMGHMLFNRELELKIAEFIVDHMQSATLNH